MADSSENKGVYVKLQNLVMLQYKAAGFHFLSSQPLQSLLAGRHSSRLRGRGLDFEELRRYHPGDDTRTIDWKVTNRAREAYVRVYGEEKERTVNFVVDQRLSMFFGSQRAFKSVTALEALALGAWKVLASGDRVGGLVFNDNEIIEMPARRSKKNVTGLLQEAVKMNNSLGLNRGIVEDGTMLNNALERLSRKRQHNSLIIIISDFSGLTDKTCESVKEMAQHNDVILSLIYDPLAQEFPKFKIPLSISDGANHLDLHSYSDKLVGKIPEVLLGRLQSLNDALAKFGVPVLPISTAEDVDLQLRRLLGNGQAPVFGRNKSFLKGKR